MYYPIGWHKVLKLDATRGDLPEFPGKILQIQGNHEKELFLILTSTSIHIWFPKPAAEIVCHRRSKESIGKIGLNKSAIWRIDSSVIVVATEGDQLLFYQLKRRSTTSSASSFLVPAALNGGEGLYRLKYDPKNTKTMLNGQLPPDSSEFDLIPSLTMFSFGKLDLSRIGISCLMAAEEELVIGSRSGDMYGVHWDGNVDDKFPWSLSKEVQSRGDYLVDLKFSSVLSGFALVFKSGRVGYMPLRSGDISSHEADADISSFCDTNISYLPHVDNAVKVEINHRNRLIAFGLRNSKVIVCNIGERQSNLIINHVLDLKASKIYAEPSHLGPVKTMSYSPDNAALAVAWESGGLAIWTVFGSLLFCSQQWQQDCDMNARPIKPIQIKTLAWGREGYNLWLCNQVDRCELELTNGLTDSMSSSMVSEHELRRSKQDSDAASGVSEEFKVDQVVLMPLARSNFTSSPHSTCSCDSIVLMTEDKILIGASVPHEDKFDHWISIDAAQVRSQYPIRYAIVDRECKKLAVAGLKAVAIYHIELNKWRMFTKQAQQNLFTVCGDLIWWQDYLIASCFNFASQNFELRAYATLSQHELEPLDDEAAIIQPISLEIVRMSIFENRLLVLYIDGTLGMFMLSLRKRAPKARFVKRPSLMSLTKKSSSSIDSTPSRSAAERESIGDVNSISSASTKPSLEPASTSQTREQVERLSVILHISAIENLIISNLKANYFCISSIALTRLHFKNNRHDDSILLNACGKLFLLERELSPITPVAECANNSTLSSMSSDRTTPDSKDAPQSLESQPSSAQSGRRDERVPVDSTEALANSMQLASVSLRATRSLNSKSSASSSSNVTFRAVSVIATNVEQFWISPDISTASEMSYFRRSLWLLCGNGSKSLHSQASSLDGLNQEPRAYGRHLQVWLPLLNGADGPPDDLYVPDRIMLPIRCDIYPLAIRSSSTNHHHDGSKQGCESSVTPDDAIVLGAESEILYRDCSLFTHVPMCTVKRQCRLYLHRILRELLLSQHLGYYAKKIAERCQPLPYFAHCFELLLHEVLEEEATSPVPIPDPMLPQVVKFIKQFPQVYLETVIHCARKSELSMWSHLFDERAVGNPRRLFQECLEKRKLDTAASCLIILQSLDKNVVSSKMVKELMRSVKQEEKFGYLQRDLEAFIQRAELDRSLSESPSSTG